jgi:hypothetical protein
MTSGDGPAGEELLGPTRPLLPRRVRHVAIGLLVLGLAAGVAVAAWPDENHDRPGAAPTSRSLPGPTPAPTAEPHRTWPTARAACDEQSELPLVTRAVPARARTGISVLIGGAGITRLDFDSGRAERPVRFTVSRDEYVGTLAGGASLRIVTYNCRGPDAGRPRLFEASRTGVTAVPAPRRIDDFLIDGPRMWGLHWAPDGLSPDILIPLDGGKPVRLPTRFVPEAITEGVLVGNFARSSNGPGQLLLVDATSGQVRRSLGAGQLLAASNGVLVWTTGCDAELPAPCRAHRQAIRGGPVATYPLPRPPAGSATSISPDGRYLAFALERAGPDPRFANQHPFPPADLAVLNLSSGEVETVPGIEIPAKYSAALAFTGDGWLVIALAAGTRTRVLAWRPGLPHPMETRPVAGLITPPPPLLVLPRR